MERYFPKVQFQALVALLLLASNGFSAPLSMTKLFSDNMVLQRDMPVPVWGWAEPGEAVVVRIEGQEKRAVADDHGDWMVKLEPLEAGGPFEMTVEGKTKLVLKNILVGEVWLCSGQSNMYMKLADTTNSAEEIKKAKWPSIRVNNTWSSGIIGLEPHTQMQGRWSEIDPTSAKDISAVAYFFGLKLHQELNVPVGLIISSIGGTPGEAWTSRQGLQQDQELKSMLDDLDKAKIMYPPKDDGAWEKADFNDADWKLMKMPEYWQRAGLLGTGTVWFRKNIEIPKSWSGKDLKFHSGALFQSDITYFNGEKIGGMTSDTQTPREYTIPAQLVKAGPAVLAIRITSEEFCGGILGKPEDMELSLAEKKDGESSMSLAGDWKYGVAKFTFGGDTKTPTTLYNGFIAPLCPFAIRGAIWYQGESNVDRARQYRRLLPALIRDWRQHWGQGDFSFGIVQLPGYGTPKSTLTSGEWAELREAQLLTAKTVPNVGLAVTIDSEDRSLHPQNKPEVGLRLARWALGATYRKENVFSGPIFESMAVENGKIRLRFSKIGSGLEAKGGKLKEFAIAGEDQKFEWAEAFIDGDTVVVSSKSVPNPQAVRYAWGNSPVDANLFNKEGFPASPFRTDDWLSNTDKSSAIRRPPSAWQGVRAKKLLSRIYFSEMKLFGKLSSIGTNDL